jgi:hypothetical protein
MVAVRLHVVTGGYLTVGAGSSIHANEEKRGSEEKEGMRVLKRVTDRGQEVMIPRESFEVYVVYVHTVEGQAQINGASRNRDGVA